MGLQSNLKELHIAHNKIASSGLALILDVIAKQNRTLKFLDISYNLVDIGLLRSLRLMLERNTSLNYLTVSDLHKFNQRALDSLSESLATSTGIKLMDFKKTTRPFFQAMEDGVNLLRENVSKPHIIFLKDS